MQETPDLRMVYALLVVGVNPWAACCGARAPLRFASARFRNIISDRGNVEAGYLQLVRQLDLTWKKNKAASSARLKQMLNKGWTFSRRERRILNKGVRRDKRALECVARFVARREAAMALRRVGLGRELCQHILRSA